MAMVNRVKGRIFNFKDAVDDLDDGMALALTKIGELADLPDPEPDKQA